MSAHLARVLKKSAIGKEDIEKDSPKKAQSQIQPESSKVDLKVVEPHQTVSKTKK